MVIASTNTAPGITGGLGTGISKYRHPTPTTKLTKTPIRSFIDFSNNSRRCAKTEMPNVFKQSVNDSITYFKRDAT